MPDEFDIAIGGASLAGSTCAILLARYGLRIALFDKSTFPRSKACGEGLSCQGVKVLSDLGIASTLPQKSYSPIHGYSLWLRKGEPLMIQSASPGIGINRFVLDNLLVSQAANSPEVTYFGAQGINSIDSNDGTVKFGSAVIRAKFIVDASGTGLKIGAKDTKSGPRRFGVTFQINAVRSFPLQQVEIAPSPFGEIFCTPVGPSRLNVSFLGYAHRQQGTPSLLIMRQSIEAFLGRLGFTGIQILSSCAASLPLARRSPVVGDKVIRIGDACEQLDPIGGLGMTHALLSAQLAADTLKSVLVDGKRSADALREYKTGQRRMVSPLRAFTALTSRALCSWSRLPLIGRAVTQGVGARLCIATHRPEMVSFIERKALSAIGGVL